MHRWTSILSVIGFNQKPPWLQHPMYPCQDKALTISTANPIAQKRKRYYHQSHKFLPVLTLISCCLVHKTFQQHQEQEKISVKLNRSFGVSC
uniref:Putative ovule protein n=1 Tax=Solanum chacoense TaxID=4108 RepID=A0A0V0IYW6_SOLCH